MATKKIEDPQIYPGIQWSVIFTGAVVASAISIVLTQFGGAIGLTSDAPLLEGEVASWGVIAIGIWVLWTQLVSSMAGGYIAGLTRDTTPALTKYHNEMRDGIYGLSVWALSTVGVFIVLSIGAAAVAYAEINTPGNQVAETLSSADENAAIIFAFVAGSSSVVSAAVAWWAAVMGGHHRTNKTDFSDRFSFLK